MLALTISMLNIIIIPIPIILIVSILTISFPSRKNLNQFEI